MSYLGLSNSQVEELRKKFGYNEIPKGKEATALTIFLRQFKSVMIYILVAVLLLSLVLEKSLHALIVFIIINVVILLGFINEYRANKELKSLRKLIVPTCVVIRNGKKQIIPSKELVPGDIVYLTTGDVVPADGFVIDCKELKINESILTGESEPVTKKSVEIQNLDQEILNSPELFVEILDKLSPENKVFMSTSVVEGYGYIKITHTGKNTEFGKIARLMKQQDKDTVNLVEKPLEGFTIFAIFMVVLTFFLFLSQNVVSVGSVKEFFTSPLFFEALTVSLAMLVSGIPEGLPVVVTITLALGVKEMSKKNALVNRMSSLEALGKVSFICTDKTGTLTKNQLTVEKFFFNDKIYNVTGVGYNTLGKVLRDNKPVTLNEVELFADAVVLCNNSELKDITEEKNARFEKGMFFEVIGSTTEGSLLVLGEKLGLNKLDLGLKYPKIEEIPFSSDRKLMATLHNFPLTYVIHHNISALDPNINEKHLEKTLFVKGAPEIILEKSTKRIENDRIIHMSNHYRETIETMIRKLSAAGNRVLAVAVKKVEDEVFSEDLVSDLIFLGFVAIKDAPREDVPEAIKIAKKAGIKVMMITGDHKNTAEAIAKEVGLIDTPESLIITGPELDSLSDKELESIVEEIKICARARPEHKLRIIKALKNKEHIVAMTGDGVNDAPALKAADVGIALGSGTEVAKDASDIILKDDSFATIVAAIKEGRRIFENLQKFTSYQFACNIAELSIIFLSVLFNVPTALTALQILFMNLVTDDLPAIALASNKASKDILSWKPKKEQGLFNKSLKRLTVMAGIIMTILAFSLYYHSLKESNQNILLSRGISLFLLILLELAFAYSFRSFRKPFIKINMKENSFMNIAIVVSLLLTLLIYLTPLSKAFEVSLFGFVDLIYILFLTALGLILVDFFKLKIMKGYYK